MRALGDAALVEEMRRGNEMAFREFIVRFEEQLGRHARRLGYVDAERRTIVAETLDDAALTLIAPGRPTPRSLPTYLVTALRNRVRNERRSGARARVREGLADRGDQRPLACSEGSLQASAGPSWEPPTPSPAVAGLCAALVGAMTDDELRLLSWVSHHIAYREIAAWIGIGYAAVGKRVERLRARMSARATAYLATVSTSERAALESLLARGAVSNRLDAATAAFAALRIVPREGASR